MEGDDDDDSGRTGQAAGRADRPGQQERGCSSGLPGNRRAGRSWRRCSMRSRAGSNSSSSSRKARPSTEPVPSRDNRRGILAFEATEGGAGVLGRLTSEPQRSHGSRERRSSSCTIAISTRRSPRRSALADREARARDCVKGCYRCLLSYYNQPDHELIDRTERPMCGASFCGWREARREASASKPEGRRWAVALRLWRVGACHRPMPSR